MNTRVVDVGIKLYFRIRTVAPILRCVVHAVPEIKFADAIKVGSVALPYKMSGPCIRNLSIPYGNIQQTSKYRICESRCRVIIRKRTRRDVAPNSALENKS